MYLCHPNSVLKQKKTMTNEEAEKIVKDFNEIVEKQGSIVMEKCSEEQYFIRKASHDYYSHLRYRKYSREDMEMRGFHKNLCVKDLNA